MDKNSNKTVGSCRSALIAGAMVIVITVVAIYNIIANEKFWEVSVGTCLTLLVAVIVSYYLVQSKANEKSKKEALIRLMTAIQGVATDEKSYTVNCKDDTKILTMKKRQLSNYIKVLENYEANICDSEDIKFVKDKFEEYDSKIGDHIDDIDYLCKSYNDLRRPLDLIDSKLYEMIMKLYI